jgi:hypothetical protein
VKRTPLPATDAVTAVTALGLACALSSGAGCCAVCAKDWVVKRLKVKMAKVR